MDWLSALLLGLLAITLLAFAYGIIPYPYGVLVLLAMLVTRILFLNKKK